MAIIKIVRRSQEGKPEVAVVVKNPVNKQRRSSRHKPVRECNKCHAGKTGLGRRQTIEPVPLLCYSCHTNYNEQVGTMHGPVIVGDCTFCHNPHQSRFIHLQRNKQPDLCYRCHKQDNIKLITGHEDKLESICTDCHDPHISPEKKLLKRIPESIDDPNIVDLGR